jgi:hypothetical protein
LLEWKNYRGKLKENALFANFEPKIKKMQWKCDEIRILYYKVQEPRADRRQSAANQVRR